MGAVMAGIVTMAWSYSAENEFRNEMPRVCIAEEQEEKRLQLIRAQPDRFYPSRWWSKQVIEYEREQKAKASKES